jgi:hypothetical protein
VIGRRRSTAAESHHQHDTVHDLHLLQAKQSEPTHALEILRAWSRKFRRESENLPIETDGKDSKKKSQ